jgi:hypothetical protein
MNNYYDLSDPPDFSNDLLIEKYMNNLSNLEKLDLTQLSLEPCSSVPSVPNVPSVPSVPNAPSVASVASVIIAPSVPTSSNVNKIIKKTINIDSRFRDNYYNSKSSSFHIDLPETFKKIVAIELSAYNIPISIHAINSSNNFFVIKNNASNVSSTIDISYGNYSTPCTNRLVTPAGRNIKTVISDKLTTYDISYNIDVISGKSVFTNNSTTNTSYTLVFNTTSASSASNNYEQSQRPFRLGWKLGFRSDEYILKPGEPLISEGIVDFDSPKYLYVSITDFTNSGTNNFIATFAESIVSTDIIARIDYVHQIDEKNFYNTARNDKVQNAIRNYYGPVDIKKLNIKVLDEYGEIVDFNNMDWSFTLLLDILYD